MKKIFNSQLSTLNFKSGFTLIELLVVIAILGLLAAGLVFAIDPLDKIRAANDAKVQSDLAQLLRASEAYAASHNGYFEATLAELVSGGELKTLPTAPSGSYTLTVPGGCSTGGGTSCVSVAVTGSLQSKKYSATPFQRVEVSTTGASKTCQVDTAGTVCP